MRREHFDIAVIGGGPAGLAAAKVAAEKEAKVVLIEREASLGGILKQCVHDGFGVIRYDQKLTGPEYAQKEIDKLVTYDITTLLLTFVTKITKHSSDFVIQLVNRSGASEIEAKKIILATGCRERTSKQIGVHGTNPAGVLTAGTAQNYVNLQGLMPTRKCVILGSGDIGLIMARRLTLEGAQVVGVYEAKSSYGGLTRNVVQCLKDFDIPLHLSHTVTRVFGVDRLNAVEISKVDDKMNPIAGSEQIVECDSLILSVGLIPENEIAKQLCVPLCPYTKGAVVDQTLMTLTDNVFSCGNALHVSDLADYVSESGEIAGAMACAKIKNRKLVNVTKNKNLLYIVPQKINLDAPLDETVFYFRAAEEYENAKLTIYADEKVVFSKKYGHLRPPEMERLKLNLEAYSDCHGFSFVLEVGV